MKNISLILLALVALLSSCSTQVENKYQITGNGWEKFNGNELRISVLDTTVSRVKEVNKVIIKNGSFTFTGEIIHPQSAFLGIYDSLGNYKGWKQVMILENGNIKLVYDAKNNGFKISGGKCNDIFYNEIPNRPEIIEANKEFIDHQNIFLALPKDKQNDTEWGKVISYYKEYTNIKEAAYKDLLESHKNDYVQLFAFGKLSSYDATKKWEMLENFEAKLGLIPEIVTMKHSFKVAEEREKNKNSVGIGSIVKDFTAKNLEGKSFNLSSVLKENKYVLVEFWASWCAPCRAEIPHMKNAYAHFKDKDFEIVSFTLDHKQKSWKKASDKDEIPWINVGDLLATKSPVVKMYGVQGVPANFLVNKEGKIIALNLRGKQLDEKLDELLK